MGLQPKFINPFAHTTWPQGVVPQPAPAGPQQPQVLDPRTLFSPEIRLPMPTLPGPVLPPVYQAPDIAGMREKAAQLFAPLPEPTPRQKPIPRPKPESIDITPFLAQMEQYSKPKDYREDETKFKNDKFWEGIAAAALASTQSDDLGEVIALAGGAFLGASQDADKQREMETRQFEAEMRAHQMNMTNFRMQAEEMRIAAANTASEIDFLNASDAAMYLDAEADRHEAWLLNNRSLAQQGFATEMDLLGLESDIANNTAESIYRRDTVKNDWETQQALRAAGTYKVADDGLSYSWDRWDPTTGQQIIQNNIPLGKLGEYQAVLRAASLMPGPIGTNMTEQATNQLGAQLDPVMYKQHVLSQILAHPKAPGLFNRQGEWALHPILARSEYEIIVQKAEEALANAKAQGVPFDAEKEQQFLQEIIVQAMAPKFTQQTWDAIAKWNDPKINSMLQWMQQ